MALCKTFPKHITRKKWTMIRMALTYPQLVSSISFSTYIWNRNCIYLSINHENRLLSTSKKIFGSRYLICVKHLLPADINLFKVNNENTRTACEICSSYQKRHQNSIINVVPMSLSLTLNRFYTVLWRFHCWLWASKCQLG